MGYTTEFTGAFKFDSPLNAEEITYLQKFNDTRRMARNLDSKYGVEGEFFVDGDVYFGQNRDDSIIDYNRPPRTQPGLWCQWRPTDDGQYLEWDGGEKFYRYIDWLQYIIDNFVEPHGKKLNGIVEWEGEETSDKGVIVVENNVVKSYPRKSYATLKQSSPELPPTLTMKLLT